MRVLVRLPNWLGYTVMAVPLLRSLRAGLSPEDPVALAGPWATVLAGQGLAASGITYPRTWTGRLQTADSVGRFNPDVVLVLPNSFEAALAAWYWGGRRRIGYDTAGRGRLLTDRLPLPEPRCHQIDEYLGLLVPLGIAPVTREPRLEVADGETVGAEARDLLAAAGQAGRPCVGIHLGAAFGASKVWPPERVAELCRSLDRRGLTPMLLGPPEDSAAERRVRDRAEAPVPSLVGRDRPELLPALLARLDALVSGDTGVAHLAAALGTPVVTLFGPTDPRLTAPRGPAAVITKSVACAPCFQARCPIDHVCMRTITGEEVAEAVLGAMGASASAATRPGGGSQRDGRAHEPRRGDV